MLDEDTYKNSYKIKEAPPIEARCHACLKRKTTQNMDWKSIRPPLIASKLTLRYPSWLMEIGNQYDFLQMIGEAEADGHVNTRTG